MRSASVAAVVEATAFPSPGVDRSWTGARAPESPKATAWGRYLHTGQRIGGGKPSPRSRRAQVRAYATGKFADDVRKSPTSDGSLWQARGTAPRGPHPHPPPNTQRAPMSLTAGHAPAVSRPGDVAAAEWDLLTDDVHWSDGAFRLLG